MKIISITLFLFSISSICISQNKITSILNKIPESKLPFNDSIGSSPKDSSYVLSYEEWNIFGFDTVEKFNKIFNYSVFSYSIKDSILVLFMERCYVEESIHWACVFKDEKLIDWIEIAYDNSEGFIYIDSEIKKSEIIKKTWNIYNEPMRTSVKYEIKTKGFIKKE